RGSRRMVRRGASGTGDGSWSSLHDLSAWTSDPRVPGVVAMATDRQRNIHEGAAGKCRLDRDADMTTDTVFAIFSTTKAITGTAALQLVEEGKQAAMRALIQRHV